MSLSKIVYLAINSSQADLLSWVLLSLSLKNKLITSVTHQDKLDRKTLTWFLCGLWYNTHSDMKYATIAFPPRAVTCARTMARTSVTKL